SLVSGRRILQRYTLLSTPLFQLPFGFDELKQPCCRNLLNSLNLKEFSVSTAPEVGRIIDVWNLPSTVNFAFLSITCRLVK
ncbi:hypothetical protein, partial [Pseudomonas sp. NPDC087804]|uniref:hypothetical protein n=1 Tax=Pseudomonas sp. NPDC087804 TaxID=3364449 RepID=UPI003809A197